MTLNGSQKKQFKEALSHAFPDIASLEQFLTYGDLVDAIGSMDKKNLESACFSLVKWAEGKGKLSDLLDAAKKQNPGNPALKNFHLPEPETSENGQIEVEKRQAFVRSYQYDIAISFANKDKEWTSRLQNQLSDLLKQNLNTASGFKIYDGNDFAELENVAMLLIIASPDYIKEYAGEFKKIEHICKQKPVFLVEVNSYKLPEELQGLSRHKFWYDDENDGIVQLNNDAYFNKINQLSVLVSGKLQELKVAYKLEKDLLEKREKQQAGRRNNQGSQPINAFVFLHSAPEDLGLMKKILPLLEARGIDIILPMERHKDTLANQIHEDIESSILICDAILILYEETTPIWVRKQLKVCRSLKNERKKPIKIIAVHQNAQNPSPGVILNNLNFHTYLCPPKQIETYLRHFIEALI